MKNLQEKTHTHIPVMTGEVLKYLNLNPDGIYIDGTIGGGGHSKMILSMLSSKGKLIGIDRDPEALALCRERFNSTDQISLHHNSYHNIDKIMEELDIQKVNGILLDLGLSSLQLNSKRRGFSFKNDGRIDMRFDNSSGTTAEDFIKGLTEKELANIIFEFSEERRSRRISKAIKEATDAAEPLEDPPGVLE